MEASRVIKLSRDDEGSSHVLLRITQIGPKALDVRLEASEGEAPYFTTLKHQRTSSLRAKNAPVSELEWEIILQSIFSQEPVPDIQATASVEDGSSLVITVRKQIQGITQRLGSVSLRCDPSQGLDIFQWCISSQDALEKSNEALLRSVSQARELEATVKELKSQLEELVLAKQQDETALLSKLRDLLNEKKVKIREQQKMMAASSQLDGGATAHQQVSSPSPQSRISPKPGRQTANKSRPAKRKALDTGSDQESSGEGHLAQTSAAAIKSEPFDSDKDSTTDATASGDDDNDLDDEEEDVGDATQRGATRFKGQLTSQRDKIPDKVVSKRATETMPPARNLPFTRKMAPETTAGPAPTNDDDDDDEL